MIDYLILNSFVCSQKIEQKGKDNEGLNGFLNDEIRKGLRYGRKKRCNLCQKIGATLSCEDCSLRYHFTCGIQKGGAGIFRQGGRMESFCSLHRPTSSYMVKLKLSKDRTCLAGCLEDIDEDDKRYFDMSLVVNTKTKYIFVTSYNANFVMCVLFAE